MCLQTMSFAFNIRRANKKFRKVIFSIGNAYHRRQVENAVVNREYPP